MPIVAIKLNDHTVRGYKGVNAELTTDDMLWQVGKPQLVQQFIADGLNACSVPALLIGVHLHQLSMAIRVGVATSQRAILDVVCLFSGWRPAKYLAAYSTGVFGFFAALPLDLVRKTAEIVFAAQPIGMDVDHYATPGAWLFSPGFWSALRARAGDRAKPLGWPKPARHLPATTFAGNCSFFVLFCHTLIIA